MSQSSRLIVTTALWALAAVLSIKSDFPFWFCLAASVLNHLAFEICDAIRRGE